MNEMTAEERLGYLYRDGLTQLAAQQQAAEFMKSKQWKALVKDLKKKKMNTSANRMALLTMIMNQTKIIRK